MAEVGADLWYSTWQTNDKRDGFRWANEQILFVPYPCLGDRCPSDHICTEAACVVLHRGDCVGPASGG
jgi:hypothetical protein